MTGFTRKYNPSLLFRKVVSWRAQHINNNRFMLILSIIVGVGAGFMAFVLRSAVHFMRKFLQEDVPWDSNWLLIFLPIIGITLTVFFIKYVIKDPVKYNITDLLHAISKRNSRVKTHKIYSSVGGAALTAGFGGSVGLESPIIMSGAALGSSLGRWFKLNYKEITLLLACGTSGAIAAIFNTPIAAVVFALEVLMLDLTRYALIPLLASSISGAVTSRILFTEDLIMSFPSVEGYSSGDLVFFIFLGIISGFASFYFSKIYLSIEERFDKIKKIRYKIIIGGIALGLLLFLFPSLYGEGYTVVKDILNGNEAALFENSILGFFKSSWGIFLAFFLALVLFKVVATATTIGSGGIGGIFAPAIFTGAALGYAFAYFNNHLGLGAELSTTNFALVGMASMLGGVLSAPLTGIFLIAEITEGYQLILPLMMATTISFITVKSLMKDSIITLQLAQRGELITHHKDKAILNFMRLESIIETDFLTIPVSARLRDLVDVIAHSNRSIIPVISEDKELMGEIHLNDVREIMFRQELYDVTNVGDLMIVPPAFIHTTDSMQTVMDKFQKTDAWNLPVVEEGKYAGFISKSKMFSVYRKYLLELSED